MDWVTKEVRAAGTKTHTRDRMARVADWAWPIFWGCAKDHLPTARLWQETQRRFTVSDWHREAVKALTQPPYPLKNARHHWAVRILRNGAPIHVVQAQLAHSTAKLTLDTYSAFVPRSEDRGQGRGAGDGPRPSGRRSSHDGPYVHPYVQAGLQRRSSGVSCWLAITAG